MNNEGNQPHSTFRDYDLGQWLKSMRRVMEWRGRNGAYGPDALSAFCAVWVELSGWRRELGVFDQDRISEIAILFALDIYEVKPVWDGWKTQAEDAYADNRRAAERALDRRTDTVTVSRRRLIDGVDVARAFDITPEVKQSAFSARWITQDDGTVTKAPRLRTRLPTLKADNPVPALTPMNVSLRTRAERQAICDRLGWKPDTVSLAARTKTPVEFDAWIAKRESETWPHERLEGWKQPGESDWHATYRLKSALPKTRNRKRGVTAARRAMAALTGNGLTKVKATTAGWTLSQIEEEIARISTEKVSRPTRYGCHVRPDKNDGNTPISLKSTPNSVCQACDISGRDSQVQSAKKVERDRVLTDRIRAGMSEWYREKKGRDLKPETIRQWRKRGRLETIVFEVCGWMQDREWSAVSEFHGVEGVDHDAVRLVRAAVDDHGKGAASGMSAEACRGAEADAFDVPF